MIHRSLWLAVLAWLGAQASTSASGCLRYEPAVSVLQGRVMVVQRYGAPNLGETPSQDERIMVPMLVLPHPVDVCGDPASELNSETEKGVSDLQLVGDSLSRWKGKAVRVTGTLMHAQTGWHYTKVLITVQQVVAVADTSHTVPAIPAWRGDQSCQSSLGRERFSVEPVSPARSGVDCPHKTCAHLPNGGLVCQCMTDSSRTIKVTGIGALPLQLEREWSRSLPDWFDVVQADLDGDGNQELAVAVLDAVSNGMSVAYWTVYALSPGRSGWGIDSLSVQDYSSTGSWIAVPGEKRCNLLQTEWMGGFEPGRGWGLYLHANWQTIESGRFVQRVDRPILRRRYLFSFERERGDTTIRPAAPWAWLRSAKEVAGSQ